MFNESMLGTRGPKFFPTSDKFEAKNITVLRMDTDDYPSYAYLTLTPMDAAGIGSGAVIEGTYSTNRWQMKRSTGGSSDSRTDYTFRVSASVLKGFVVKNPGKNYIKPFIRVTGYTVSPMSGRDLPKTTKTNINYDWYPK